MLVLITRLLENLNSQKQSVIKIISKSDCTKMGIGLKRLMASLWLKPPPGDSQLDTRPPCKQAKIRVPCFKMSGNT